jgi:hypothetical protein
LEYSRAIRYVDITEVEMQHACIILITLAMMAVSPVGAQSGSVEQVSSCVAEPIFHCVQHLDGGSAVGRFGYNLRCPDDADPAAELFIDIGDENLFSPGRVDRGQPIVFLPGEHVDEWEVDFSSEEVKSDSEIHWSILDKTVTVDFSKTKDGSLDCNNLPY